MNCPGCQAPLKPDAAACLECGAVPPAAGSRRRSPEDWGNALFRILMFDEAVVADVAADPRATYVALGVVAFAGAAYAGGMVNPLLLFIGPVVMLVSMAGTVSLTSFVANCLGGKGTFLELFRVQGLTYVLQLVSAVPVIGTMLGGTIALLQILYLANAVKVVHKLPVTHAIAAAVIPSVLCWLFVVFVVGAMVLALLTLVGGAVVR